MKILQINSTLNWGSTGRIAEEIGQIVISEGGESYIAYGRYANISQSKSIRIGTKWDIYNHVMQTRLFDKHGLASKNATNVFIKQIEEINPDIIHLHNIHGYYLNYPILFKYLASVDTPVVWTLHDCWPFTGHCAHFETASCHKWKTTCNHCPLKSSYPCSLFLDYSKKNFLTKRDTFTIPSNITIVTVSEWLKSIVEKSFLNKFPIRTIYNGVDTSSFKPTSYDDLKRKLHSENKKVLLGVATTWTESKGLYDYYKLANQLSSEIQIVLVGLNKRQIKDLPSNILGVERTESIQQLTEYYSMADVVLNLSYQETFGLTTVEGFSCGTPSIVYNRTASPELISDDTGIIVEAGNINKLQNAVEQLLSKEKKHYRNACRNKALLLFDSQNNFQKYIDLYNDLILKHK